MNASRAFFCAAALVGLTACPLKKNADETSKSAEPASSVSAPPVASVSATPPPEAKPAIEPKVKAEVDARADGITGTPLAVSGALATLQTPKEWAATKGDVTIVGTADKKTQLAATAFSTTEGPAVKLPAALTALGLTACEWGANETLTIGKTKLAGAGADGVCKRGEKTVRTAWVAPTAEHLLVVGAWEADGDSANVFGAMRAIAKPPAGDTSGLAACCAALRQDAKMAPPEHRATMLMVAATCDSLRTNPQGRAMIAQMRAQLRGAHLPGACR